MKSQTFCLLEALLQDAGEKCHIPIQRDCKTVADRIAAEGDGFTTIILPGFGKSFDRALADGRIAPVAFPDFKKVRKGSVIPAFLRGFLELIFDRNGELLNEPSICAIECVRQICRAFSKVQSPCREARTTAAIEGFVKTDEELTSFDVPMALRVRAVVNSIFDEFPRETSVLMGQVLSCHGGGAVADGLRGNQKWSFPVWSKRLSDAGFNPPRWFVSQSSQDEGESETKMPKLLDLESELEAKLATVPKTQKTPRLISIEPSYAQWAQQGLRGVLVQYLEDHPVGRRHLNLRDQTVNGEAALRASRDGTSATLDLSEASDRVSNALVEFVFADQPALLAALRAVRTTHLRLPDGRVIALRKYASMGSAVTFVIESLLFFGTVVATIAQENRTIAGTWELASKYASGVSVYGDDIVVPTRYASAVCRGLNLLGFKVNEAKSFWNGKFRESCGVDAYDGHRVTPVYVRRFAPATKRDARELVSWVATANQLFEHGYVRAALHMRQRVERVLGKLPCIREALVSQPERVTETSALAWVGFAPRPVLRWDRHLQRAKAKLWVAEPIKEPDPLEGYGALAKCLVLAEKRRRSSSDGESRETWTIRDVIAVAPGHLESSPRPYALTLKRRWVAI